MDQRFRAAEKALNAGHYDEVVAFLAKEPDLARARPSCSIRI